MLHHFPAVDLHLIKSGFAASMVQIEGQTEWIYGIAQIFISHWIDVLGTGPQNVFGGFGIAQNPGVVLAPFLGEQVNNVIGVPNPIVAVLYF